MRAKVLHRLKRNVAEAMSFHITAGVMSLIGIAVAASPSPWSAIDRLSIALGASVWLIGLLLVDLTSPSSEERAQKRREMRERELAEMKKRQE